MFESCNAMIFLALSILCSTVLGLIFRSFPKYGVHNLQAIIVNYFVCIACSSLLIGGNPISPNLVNEEYFIFAIILGFLFIGGFNLVALATQKLGITIAAILQKMSMVFSVSAAFILYKEEITAYKVIGILMACVAVVLCNWPQKDRSEELKSNFLLAAVTLAIASAIEILLQYCELRVLEQSGDPKFLAALFGTAGCLGVIFFTIGLILKKWTFHPRNIVAGIVLGTVNYGSIYFLLRTLGVGWDGSVVFPLNNLGIILFSAAVGFFILKESLTKINLIGVGLSLLAILIIMLS